MLWAFLILAALLIAIPSACLVMLIRAEKKRDEMDRRYSRELLGDDVDEETKG
jgi:hypothetical protein